MAMVDSDSASVVSCMVAGFTLVHRRNQTKNIDPDSVSVVSKSCTKGSFFGKTMIVVEDTSSDDDDESSLIHSHEFVIECMNDETVFITAEQGKRALKRCHPLRNLILEAYDDGKGQVLQQPKWPAANVRRLIEVLTTGSAWIENDASSFVDFQKFAKEVGVDIRLTSLINYTDALTSSATQKFFKMMHINNYQFKLRATLKSSQWLYLLKMGILLMSKSKLLGVRMADFKSKTATSLGASEERLAKCDNIPGEFCVYASGNMQALLVITRMLTSSPVSGTTKAKCWTLGEDIKLIFKVRIGSLSHEELAMLWRMTDSSLTMSSLEEQAYLDSSQTGASQSERDISRVPRNMKEIMPDHPSVDHSDNASEAASTAFSSLGIPNPIAIHPLTNEASHNPSSESYSNEYHYRTLSGKSFLAFKYVFDAIYAREPDLSVCLVVKAPSPDTLGRLINATRQTSIHRLDFDPQTNVYYTCKSSIEIKKILAYMGDYSSSAVIKGDFQLCQRIE